MAQIERRELTVTEAARALGVCTATVRHWCATDQIPAYRVGARWRIDLQALEARAGDLYDRMSGW